MLQMEKRLDMMTCFVSFALSHMLTAMLTLSKREAYIRQ